VRSLRSLRSRSLLAVCASLLVTCGGEKRSPSSSTPATAPPAIPAPSPSAPAAPAATACSRLAPAPPNVNNCSRQSPTFLSEVDQAINRLQSQQPEIFNGEQVLSVGRYYVGLIDQLEAQGVCADFDGEELQATNSSRFSDQYHVLTSKNTVRRGESSYRATCSPAALPIPAPPLAPTPGCSLPPSKEKACSREAARFLPQVEAAIAKAVQEHPDYFELGDIQPGTDWYKVRNDDAYFNAVVDNLRQAGVCARYDGEELAAKIDNRSSEQYDIHTGQGYIRRGDGSYRTSCYPAAF
jgi:hypothetical protein